MTLNEVNIIKNSVLDATEAYVDARLSVADFAKTQIGVTEGTPRKASGKYYHTVVCNAISNVEGSGVVYHNVLSVGNTPFPDGSVVFLIAPNAQFSNQFILGKLDDTPVHITGGTIDIGDGNFAVDADGNVTIKKGGIYLNKTGDYYHLNLDKDGIRLGRVSNGYNFTVNASDGTVSIRRGSIQLGETTIGETSTYKFIVDNQGNVNIRSGSINLTYNDTLKDYNFKVNSSGINLGITGDSETNKAYNFTVNNNGKVTIRKGSINLNYVEDSHLTTGKYGFVIDENGSLSVGAYAYQNPNTSTWSWQYHFKVTKDGDLTAGTNFKLDKNGNLFSGGTTTGTAKFYVTNTGNMYVGGTTSSAPFVVDNTGNVAIKKGSITLGTISVTSSKYLAAFSVTDDGVLSIRNGSIQLGYRTSPRDNVYRYDVNISSGGFKLGYLGEDANQQATYNFSVTKDGIITVKRGSIDLGYNSTDKKYNFSVDNNGKLFARSGTIAGFTINTNSLTTEGSSSSADTHAKTELSSTTLRVSKWTGTSSGSKRISAIFDVNDNNGRIAINGNNASAPYMAVSSSKGWNDNGNFENPLKSTSNYVKITPTSITLHEADTSGYTVGAGCFKFLAQSQEIGDIGNLQINVSDGLVIFKNLSSNRMGILQLNPI